MLDQAFEALKTYDWGMDRHVLDPIDEAVVTTHNDPAARKDLELRLLAVLQSKAPRDARDYVCRQLRTIGTAASVPALEALLADPECHTWPATLWNEFRTPRPAGPWNVNSPSLTANSRLASSHPSAPAAGRSELAATAAAGLR